MAKVRVGFDAGKAARSWLDRAKHGHGYQRAREQIVRFVVDALARLPAEAQVGYLKGAGGFTALIIRLIGQYAGGVQDEWLVPALKEDAPAIREQIKQLLAFNAGGNAGQCPPCPVSPAGMGADKFAPPFGSVLEKYGYWHKATTKDGTDWYQHRTLGIAVVTPDGVARRYAPYSDRLLGEHETPRDLDEALAMATGRVGG